MSHTIYIDTDISITSFCGAIIDGLGVARYQVTWSSYIKDHIFDYAVFENENDAMQFIELLKKRVKNR